MLYLTHQIFRKQYFVEKKVPCELEVIWGFFFKLMEVSFQSNFKIRILTCCVPYAMGIHHALETKSPLTLAKGNAIIFLIKLFSVGLFFTLSAVAHLE